MMRSNIPVYAQRWWSYDIYLCLAINTKLLGDILRGNAHGHEAGGRLWELLNAGVDASLPRHRVGAHRLHAARQANLGLE